ncbi:hypothetical protein E2C01_079576 [Portunus trituberculatus]|uniref:Uncharacterized protein n=1 Tax=Portunus trituberculatus TaxID=210409 RepID=A0A5B7IT51_PORTR|nr:hypothetical protein [Portunus trituberculatus]
MAGGPYAPSRVLLTPPRCQHEVMDERRIVDDLSLLKGQRRWRRRWCRFKWKRQSIVHAQPEKLEKVKDEEENGRGN